MENKEIYIDGVDVSGCKYFANNKCLMLCATGTACDVYPYCYYKQLKAKEQECEELKGISMKKCPKCGEVYLNSVGMEAFNQLDQLKAENEELKEQFKLAEPLYQACNIKDKKINKLKQTLTEIKELCQKHIKAEKIVMANDILQKISECEGNDE